MSSAPHKRSRAHVPRHTPTHTPTHTYTHPRTPRRTRDGLWPRHEPQPRLHVGHVRLQVERRVRLQRDGGPHLALVLDGARGRAAKQRRHAVRLGHLAAAARRGRLVVAADDLVRGGAGGRGVRVCAVCKEERARACVALGELTVTAWLHK
jgi:hypothetical protein